MANFVVLILELWLFSGLVLLLHYLHPRYGFSPLLFLVGGITVFIQSQLGVYVEPASGFVLFVSSNVLVPTVLVAVLVIYISEGTVPARMIITGVLGISGFALLTLLFYRIHLTLPQGGTITGLDVAAYLGSVRLRVTIASLLTFAVDMFVIVVFYQGVKNSLPRVPEWVVVGLSLLAALWADAIVFGTVSDLGTSDFLVYLPGDVFGKTVSALLLWPLLGFYMVRVAPKMPGHVGAKDRKTFEVLFGAFEQVKLALLRTEKALEESEVQRKREAEYFRQISDNINEALWLTEPNQHRAIYVNPAYETIWGRSADSLHSDDKAFFESIHPEDRERVVAGLPNQFKGGYDVEYRILRPDGSVCWVRDRAFPIQDEQGTVYRMAGISEDKTRRKEIEPQQIELALERDRVKLLRDFISEASHDLKTPLAAINMKVFHLSKSEDPQRKQEHLRELETLSNRMARMIDDLFTLSRLENLGEATADLIDVNHLFRGILEGVRPIVEEKQIDLQFMPDDRDLMIMAMEADLERALTNLVDNAVRYTPSSGTVSIQTRVQDGKIVVQISDSGIGISPDDQVRIFERFYRADNARSTDPGGTGLGLAITRRIIENHGGRIEVSSAVGKGTIFTVYLPLANAPQLEPS
jgi:PAS domain S-box-containing protein